MKQTASWKLLTLIQNIMFNQCLNSVQPWSAFTAEVMQSTYPHTTLKYIWILSLH